jgi:N-acetylmuramoyl-L-alanine amidase
MFKPKAIVIHCSASRWGDAEEIRRWHLARGFGDIGYHAVILNGRRDSSLRYNPRLDGKIEPGRPENRMGAHCRAGGMNRVALGVCLVGLPGFDGYPTKKQLEALIHYLSTKCCQHSISPSAITQHSDHERGKPLCASLDVEEIRHRAGSESAGFSM